MSARERVTVYQRALPHDRGALLSVTRALAARGCAVRESDDAALELRSDAMVWMLGNPIWYPKACRTLASQPPETRPFTVLWFSEPLPPPRAAGLPRPRLHLREVAKILLRDRRTTDVYSNARRLRSLAERNFPDLLVASTPARCEYLREQGVEAHCVPVGYDAAQHGRALDLGREIDVLFLGQPVPRRKRLLRQLEAAGVRVHQTGGWADPKTWGEARTRLLNRTKIFLNLARHPGELPGVRLILGMASRALVVSEPIYAPGPYVPGRHLITTTLEEMPEAIGHYLEHEDERERIAAAGYQLVTQHLTMDHAVEKILALACGRRDR